MTKQIADADRGSRCWRICRDAENATFGGFYFLKRLVAIESEERFTGFDVLTLFLQPADKSAFLHRPTKPWDCDLCHMIQADEG
jgi:hypothetical protein